MRHTRFALIASAFCLSGLLFICCNSSNNGKHEGVSKLQDKIAQTGNISKEPSGIDSRNTKNTNDKPTKSSIVNSKFAENNLFGIWTVDLKGPHADFELNKDFYYIVDYDGNGDMLYTIKDDSIVVFLKDLITKGQINKAQNDTLQISWDNEKSTIYFRWKQ